MKLEKNKILIIGVIICIILFIGVYASIVLGADEAPTLDSNQIPVPRLKDGQKEYDSKLDALNDLKEVKQTNAPSIYDERLLDSTGIYDPDLLEKDKMRMVDSIYSQGRINYSENAYRNEPSKVPFKVVEPKTDCVVLEPIISVKELGLEHQLFFASDPKENRTQYKANSIPVIVDGTQTVKTNYRLRMRLMKDAIINNIKIPRNTPVYGFVSFQPNRTIIEIENINHQPTKLKAFDLQDGSEGIYVENSFKADATREVVDDVVQDINIAGVPQIGGVKKIFQRNNRNIKVTVLNNYQLILKTQ
ncbi:conjugative transposon protein TraM [Mariniflexile aquimaris]|uniref:Conjugative transposon protein TraM n=1 Tax=Mariniflexile aquimaris TaxID=881009 RepID=A0ABW3BY35_9FLAO